MKEFLKSLGITKSGTITDDGNYLIDFTADEWNSVESILERTDELYMDDNASSVGLEMYNIQFINDEYTITMKAEFHDPDPAIYQLICREN